MYSYLSATISDPQEHLTLMRHNVAQCLATQTSTDFPTICKHNLLEPEK
jgi:hypothetical protein